MSIVEANHHQSYLTYKGTFVSLFMGVGNYCTVYFFLCG